MSNKTAEGAQPRAVPTFPPHRGQEPRFTPAARGYTDCAAAARDAARSCLRSRRLLKNS
jgi:hypothetical protein